MKVWRQHLVSPLGGIIVLVLGVLLAGCASVDTPSSASRLLGTDSQKFPLRVGVILSPSIRQVQYVGKAEEFKIIDCPRAPCPRKLVDTTVAVKIGESSAELFQKILPQAYETVEVLHSETGDLSRYQLILIPRLSSADASHQIVEVPSTCLGDGFRSKVPAATARITYELVAKDPKGAVLTTVSEMGTGYATAPPFLCLPNYARAAVLNAFEIAQAEAFAGLFRKLRSSPALESFVKAEFERQARPGDLTVEVQFDDSRALLPNSRLGGW